MTEMQCEFFYAEIYTITVVSKKLFGEAETQYAC